MSFSSTMNPASITVLHVSELLSMIFANLLEDDKDTLVSAACTCKCWWPVALDVLYETMDLKDLLALLAPVSFEAIYTDIDDDESMMSERIARYTEHISPAAFTKFQPYAERVRTLSTASAFRIDFHRLIDTVLQYKPPGLLFPKLTKLVWMDYDLTGTIQIIHPGLKALDIDRCSLYSLAVLLEYLVDRAPLLEQLCIRYVSCPSSQRLLISKEMHQLQQLKNIRKFKLQFAESLDWSTLIGYLAELPVIEHIELTTRAFERALHQGDSAPQIPFTPEITSRAFRSLSHLVLPSVDPVQLTSFFRRLGTLPSLVDFVLHSPVNTDACTAMELKELLNCISNASPRMERLSLGMHSTYTDDLLTEVSKPETQNISFDTISPILSCTRVTEFSLDHPIPVEMTTNQLELLAKSWPNLTVLSLNPCPMSLKLSHAHDLEALSILSRYCPKLTHVSLVLDASAIDVPPHRAFPILPRLKQLGVGYSDVLRDGDAIPYLAQVLPLRCKITSSPPNSRRVVNEEFTMAVNRRKIIWRHAVEKVIPVMRRVVKLQSLEVG